MGQQIVVIGAGVAGLVVARDLARAGIAVTVVEASDRLGGQLASVRIAGLDVDAAAESFATRGGVVEALAAEVGLADDIVRPLASPAWLVGPRGRSRPLPAASVLGIPADPRAPDVVRAVGALASWRAALDAVVPLRDPASYRTVGDLVRRRMGAGVLRRLVAPVVRGVYSTTPDALSLDLASPAMRDALRETGSLGRAVERLRTASPAGSQVAGIRGGVHRLAKALGDDARVAGARILLDARVVRADDAGAVLESGERLGGRVVQAAAEVAGLAVRSRSITVAIAVVDAPDLDRAPRGTGALVEDGVSEIAARAFTHASAKWQWLADELPTGRHVVRLSYDEMPGDPEATVSADLRAITAAKIGRLVELDVRTWTRTLEAHPVAAGHDAVGEASSVTGLAGIVSAARASAQRIRTDVNAARPGGLEGTR
ncbi:MAG: protoporphyrinogen/coproporphyrinogen oxidase [Microbacterium sp.]